jgi:hypothetical protein
MQSTEKGFDFEFFICGLILNVNRRENYCMCDSIY